MAFSNAHYNIFEIKMFCLHFFAVTTLPHKSVSLVLSPKMVPMSAQKQCCHFLGTADNHKSNCFHTAKDLIFAFLELLILCDRSWQRAGL